MGHFLVRTTIALAAIVLVAVIGCGLIALRPLTVTERHVLFVPEKASLWDVLDELERRSAIVSPWLWRILAYGGSRYFHLTAKMGSYELTPSTTHSGLFGDILRGRNRLVRRLTIYEGETTTHLAGAIARTLEDDSIGVLRLLQSDTLVKLWKLDGARSLEGYLLPATYDLFEKEPTVHALRRMVRVFESVWTTRLAERAARTGLSRHELLTLASIIEGEVANPSEYRRIAGVYWNRLRRGMKLEADPTVQYALGFPARRLTFRDYQVEHPYNTYRIMGLPPGPIKAPSVQAIEAALEPEPHNYLYFCSAGDSTGLHRFASTYREHVDNVRRYHRTLQQRSATAAITVAWPSAAGNR